MPTANAGLLLSHPLCDQPCDFLHQFKSDYGRASTSTAGGRGFVALGCFVRGAHLANYFLTLLNALGLSVCGGAKSVSNVTRLGAECSNGALPNECAAPHQLSRSLAAAIAARNERAGSHGNSDQDTHSAKTLASIWSSLTGLNSVGAGWICYATLLFGCLARARECGHYGRKHWVKWKLAERGGFEPPIRFNPYNGLANRRFRPLSHLSNRRGQETVFRGLRQENYPTLPLSPGP